jgi:hypothetical protein
VVIISGAGFKDVFAKTHLLDAFFRPDRSISQSHFT